MKDLQGNVVYSAIFEEAITYEIMCISMVM
jgi:hypothetical protein